MAIQEVDLVVDQGADFAFTSDPWVVDGSPVDLTGASARMMIRSSPDSTAVLVSITDVLSSDGIIVLNGTDGTVTINISHSATSNLPGDTAFPRYDTFVDLTNGTSKKLLSGRVLVSRSCTR